MDEVGAGKWESTPSTLRSLQPMLAGGGLREDSGLLLIPATGMAIDDMLVRELIDVDRHGR